MLATPGDGPVMKSSGDVGTLADCYLLQYKSQGESCGCPEKRVSGQFINKLSIFL